MPKNIKGGKGTKKSKKVIEVEITADNIIYPNYEEKQQIGKVIGTLGNCRFMVLSEENKYIVNLAGRFKGRRHKLYINMDDIVLFQKETKGTGNNGSILHKYNPKEQKLLNKEHYLDFLKDSDDTGSLVEFEDKKESSFTLNLDEI